MTKSLYEIHNLSGGPLDGGQEKIIHYYSLNFLFVTFEETGSPTRWAVYQRDPNDRYKWTFVRTEPLIYPAPIEQIYRKYGLAK